MVGYFLDMISIVVMIKIAIQDYDSCEVDAIWCVVSVLLSLVYCALDWRPVAFIMILIMLVLILIGKEIPGFGLADLCIPANIIGAFGCRVGLCLDLIVALVAYLIGLFIYKLILLKTKKWGCKPFALVPILPSYAIMLPVTYIVVNLISRGYI